MKKWEAKCKRCGLCCYEKIITEEFLFIDLDSSCGFFDTKTNTCRVYSYRFKKQKRCRRVNIFRVIFSKALPKECGYVLWAKKRHIPIRKKLITKLIHSSSFQPKNEVEKEVLKLLNK
ncbi:MAG: hypothetical protein WC162_00640 [Sphaerochaetaceae bacterium]